MSSQESDEERIFLIFPDPEENNRPVHRKKEYIFKCGSIIFMYILLGVALFLVYYFVDIRGSDDRGVDLYKIMLRNYTT